MIIPHRVTDIKPADVARVKIAPRNSTYKFRVKILREITAVPLTGIKKA
jgi:hypothetical protein